MRISHTLGMAAIAALACAAPAQAGHFTGFYWGLDAGISTMQDEDVSNDTVDPVWPSYNPTTASFDTGWGVFGKVGVALAGPPPLHFEFELGYRSNDLDNFNVQGADHKGGGSVHEFSQMINVLWTPSLNDRIDLSLGAGIGGDYVNYKNDSGFHTVPIHDNDYVFAFQLMAGISYHLGNCFDGFDCDLALNYRYFQADEPEFKDTDGLGFVHNDTYDNFNKHTVTIGLVFH